MSARESRGQAPSSFDPEAEQEVDFGRYWRLLGARWWLLAAGFVAGAIVGFGLSVGARQLYKASASLYLGQPYTASGNVQLQALQTNPSTVSTTDKLLFQLQLRTLQDDLNTAAQLLLQAQQVEAPKVLSPAAATRVTARSRRNTVVVSALIGLVLGVIAALMWDGIAAGFR